MNIKDVKELSKSTKVAIIESKIQEAASKGLRKLDLFKYEDFGLDGWALYQTPTYSKEDLVAIKNMGFSVIETKKYAFWRFLMGKPPILLHTITW